MEPTDEAIFKAWCFSLRKCKGYTQEDLAEKTGASIATVQRVENAKTLGFSDKVKRQYAKAYGYQSDQFLMGSSFYDDVRRLIGILLNPYALRFALIRDNARGLYPPVDVFLKRSFPQGLLDKICNDRLRDCWTLFAGGLGLSNEIIQKSLTNSVYLSDLIDHLLPQDLSEPIPVFQKSRSRLIVITGNKGGTGRTILATGLLAMLAGAGKSAGVIYFQNAHSWKSLENAPSGQVVVYDENQIDDALAAQHDYLIVDPSLCNDPSLSIDPAILGLCSIADLILYPVGRTYELNRFTSLELKSLLFTWALLAQHMDKAKLSQCFRGVLSDHMDVRESIHMKMIETERFEVDTTFKFGEAVHQIFVDDYQIKFMKHSIRNSKNSDRVYCWLRNQDPDLPTREICHVDGGLRRLFNDQACEEMLRDYAVLMDEIDSILGEPGSLGSAPPTYLLSFERM